MSLVLGRPIFRVYVKLRGGIPSKRFLFCSPREMIIHKIRSWSTKAHMKAAKLLNMYWIHPRSFFREFTPETLPGITFWSMEYPVGFFARPKRLCSRCHEGRRGHPWHRWCYAWDSICDPPGSQGFWGFLGSNMHDYFSQIQWHVSGWPA